MQRVLAMLAVCDIPVTQLPDTTQPRLSYVDASLVHEWGELASPQCNYCSVALSENPGRKVPHFSACILRLRHIWQLGDRDVTDRRHG